MDSRDEKIRFKEVIVNMMREDEGDKDRTRLLLLTGVNREREIKRKKW